MPRARQASFESVILPKHKHDVKNDRLATLFDIFDRLLFTYTICLTLPKAMGK